MTVGAELRSLIPLQEDWFLIATHDTVGDWAGTGVQILAANQRYNFGLFMVSGRRTLDMMVLSDVAATIYIHTGVDPYRIAQESNTHAWMTLDYVSVNRPRTWEIAIRSNIIRIDFENGATAQTVWEMSLRARNV